MSIDSFARDEIREFFMSGQLPKRCPWSQSSGVATRKLDALDAAVEPLDLRSPPGNKFEALSGRLSGYFSIRINKQWRIIFMWDESDPGPREVDIVDYH